MARYDLYLRDPNKKVGGPVMKGQLVARSDPSANPAKAEDLLRAESQVTFLVHGFNVNRPDGVAALERLAAELKPPPAGAVVSVLWPGDHFMNAASYSWEGDDADDSADALADFIEMVIRDEVPISFVSHSLGARVVLGAVDRISGTDRIVDQVCLMAPAVDDDSLSDPEVFRDAAAHCGRIGVLASVKDRVLQLAYPAGDLLQSLLFFWRDDPGLALGYHGPRAHGDEPIPAHLTAHQIRPCRESGHSDYIPGPTINDKQTSAVHYAGDLLAGNSEPEYPPKPSSPPPGA